MLAYVRGTTTETGLEVKAFMVDWDYEIGGRVSDQQMEALNLERHVSQPKG